MLNVQCPKCGQQFSLPYSAPQVKCPFCGQDIIMQPASEQQQTFSQTGPQPNYAYGPQPQQPGIFDAGPSGKSRGVAGLLAILLTGLGIHYFYSGKVAGGFICIGLTIITCGIWSVVALIQGIMLMTMTQEDYENKWVNSLSTFPLF